MIQGAAKSLIPLEMLNININREMQTKSVSLLGLHSIEWKLREL